MKFPKVALKRVSYASVGLALGSAAALSTGFVDENSVKRQETWVKDTFWIVSDKSTQVAQAAISLAHTGADTAKAVFTSRSPKDSFLQSLAERVEEWSEHPAKREGLVVVGGGYLLDWLLSKAITKPGSADQECAERAITNLLYCAGTASALLSRDEAVPKLLQLVSLSGNAEALAEQIACAAQLVTMPSVASLDDIGSVIGRLGSGQDGPLVHRLAVRYLARWAEASVVNCGKIATMGVGPVLTKALTQAGDTPADRVLRSSVAHTMSILARDCPLRKLLDLDSWMQSLLFLAADATAEKDWPLASQALDAFSQCAFSTTNLQSTLERINIWTLLHQLSQEGDSNLRRAITGTIVALGPSQVPDLRREQWTSLLLQWICADTSGDAERNNAACALAALAAVPGSRGLAVASTWLGDLLIQMSRNVRTYSSIRVGGKEMTEEISPDLVPVLPVFARSVASDLRAAFDQESVWQDPPYDDFDSLPGPTGVPRSADSSATVDYDLADAQLCRALKVMCALVSADSSKQRWLQTAGIVPLLQRLTLQRTLDADQDEEENSQELLEECMSFSTRRQCARLLAMIAASGEAQALERNRDWLRWLTDMSKSPDCKLSSHAARTLLHIESALAFKPSVDQQEAFAGMPRPPELADEESPTPLPISRRLLLRDGVHLFVPSAPHHLVLAREGVTSTSEGMPLNLQGAPLVDVVFVHGIRGGPFASWRAGKDAPRGTASESLTHRSCWPSEWLSRDVPGARLLSMEYAAPASGWEGESLPLRGTVGQLIDRLTAAGVGQRPVVFVCHSMGGILVKEMIVKAMAEGAPEHHRQLADATTGMVFYACPHLGTWLANIGWTLRFIGALPAASVVHLKPGPHLEEVNDAIRELHHKHRVAVLSFSEGQPMSITMGLPAMVVVPEETAFPGYGDLVVLQDVDHINACKPLDRQDASYTCTMEFLKRIVGAAEHEAANRVEEQPEQEAEMLPPAAN